MKLTFEFLKSCALEVLRGSRLYRGWLVLLVLGSIPGALAYLHQLDEGLSVTGMSNEVSWGAYIANFTFLVGMAAAAVMLVIPSYMFHNQHTRSVVIIAEALAVAACVMAMTFVFVDLGRPERAWHLLPFIGRLNFPASIMAWDVVALAGYLAINLAIPFFLLRAKFDGRDAHPVWFGAIIVVAIVWAIAIHTVTAFLYSANVGRPFWHTALLGPRFLASAFASGPALILLTFHVIHERTGYPVAREVMRFLSIVVTFALLTNLFMVGAEIFTELYWPTEEGVAASSLFLGELGPFVHIALAMEIVAAILLVTPRFHHTRYVLVACALCVVGVWIEKGLALIVPGFTPTPLGEVRAYTPTLTEVLVSLAIWAFGTLLFTILAKPALAIQLGTLRRVAKEGTP
jgi:molybdopterin-containing oxidoreductase family membrane subunit